VIAAPGHYDAPQRSPGVSGTGASFFAPPMRLWGKGRVSETNEETGCSSLKAISSLVVPLAQQEEIGPTLRKPRRLRTPGPGKRNQASERRLPPREPAG